jgi:hypothetical protein
MIGRRSKSARPAFRGREGRYVVQVRLYRGKGRGQRWKGRCGGGLAGDQSGTVLRAAAGAGERRSRASVAFLRALGQGVVDKLHRLVLGDRLERRDLFVTEDDAVRLVAGGNELRPEGWVIKVRGRVSGRRRRRLRKQSAGQLVRTSRDELGTVRELSDHVCAGARWLVRAPIRGSRRGETHWQPKCGTGRRGWRQSRQRDRTVPDHSAGC